MLFSSRLVGPYDLAAIGAGGFLSSIGGHYNTRVEGGNWVL
jgi:hypothetical protein